MVFENRVMRRIFGPKRDEVTGEWRKLHNEELHLILSRSIDMQLFIFFLFFHYMFRLHAAIFRWLIPLYTVLLHGSCCFCNANFLF
jgi:hypothetical protein